MSEPNPGSRPLRIATLSRLIPPLYSGGGLQAFRLARAIARRGVEVTMLTTAPGDPSVPRSEQRDGVKIERLRASTRYRGRAIDYGVVCAARLLRHREWDILHCQGFSYWAVPPVWVAQLLGRPVVVTTTLSGADSPKTFSNVLSRRAVLPAYRSCAAVVALSRAIEAEFAEDGGYRGRVLRIPNGVDVDLFNPAGPAERAAARAELGLDPAALIVVSAGAMIRRKNPAGLVRAVARMQHANLELVLAGPPEDPEVVAEVEAAIAALPAGKRARRLGHLEPHDVPRLMQAADLFALNSRAEGLPLSLVEAMAAGLPCAATDIAGTRDVLERGGGKLVPVDDDAALAEALDWLADDPERRARLAREAREIAEQHYSWDVLGGRYVELYQTLVGSGAAAATVSAPATSR